MSRPVLSLAELSRGVRTGRNVECHSSCERWRGIIGKGREGQEIQWSGSHDRHKSPVLLIPREPLGDEAHSLSSPQQLQGAE